MKGTLITMADGSQKPIEQVRTGDSVLTRDEATGQNKAGKVTQTFERTAPCTLTLKFDNGDAIETTPEHPFYVQGKGWVPAGELGIGTSIVTRAGPTRVLSTSVSDENQTVYNFEVEGTHSYFVGENALWVHNYAQPTYVIDENLPPQLAAQMRREGADAIHVKDLLGVPRNQSTGMKDPELRKFLDETGVDWRMVTKDINDWRPGKDIEILGGNNTRKSEQMMEQIRYIPGLLPR